MKRLFFLIAVLLLLTGISCRSYKKGDKYVSVHSDDSVSYLIMDQGSGMKLAEKANREQLEHAYKGNACEVVYLTDSTEFITQKGILLFHIFLPNVEEDMLTKGYFGTFTSRQEVKYVLVSKEDFEKLFILK
ncbi:MAG: hypothetical protein JXA72_05595 [Bacteroidales bacterium]|nr:hypothetical protein [Bacteroidales bacterium]